MNRNSKLLPAGIVLTPILIWVFVILYYSANVPWYDDFDPFPDFLRKWIESPDASTRFTLLFQPNNEHRMVIGKLVMLCYYWATGHLNFTFLHIAGACFILGVLYIFWSAFKSARLNAWYFVPVAFFIFQLQYHLTFLWAICGMQHETVIFFVCLSVLFLAQGRFLWAVAAGVLASFSMSSGLFVWPAGIMVLLFASRYKELAVWTLAGVLAIVFYFSGMSTQGNESSIDFLIQNPHLSVLGFFASLGGLFDFLPEKNIVFRSVLPVLAGLLVVIWVVIWLWRYMTTWLGDVFKKSRPNISANAVPSSALNSFLLGILTYLLVNALVICILRPRFGFFVMIVSNYKIYPALFLCASYLTFISTASSERMREVVSKSVLVISVLIWLFSMYGYLPVISERHKYYTANGYNQEYNGFGLGHVPFSAGARYVDDLMKFMVREGIYQYPASGHVLAEKLKSISGKPSEEHRIDVEERGKSTFISSSGGGISPFRTKAEYVFARNAERLYIFKMEPFKYSGRNFLRQYDKGSGFELQHSTLMPGEYELGIADVDGDSFSGGILGKITIP